MAVIEQRVRIGAGQRDVAFGLGGLFTGIEHADGLHQHLGVLEQVGADLGPERGAFGVGHRGGVLCDGGPGKAERQKDGQGKASVHDRLQSGRAKGGEPQVRPAAKGGIDAARPLRALRRRS